MPDSMAPGAGGSGETGPGNPATAQRILVLGAGGFIGQRVVAALARSGWACPVAAVHRRPAGLAPAMETIRLDARQSPALRAAVRDVAGVVNCITGDGQTIRESARALFDACADAVTPRVVHLSTMMVYGTATGTLDETAHLRGDWDEYSAAKRDVEAMARTLSFVVHLRPGIVYGPHSPIWTGWIGQWLLDQRLGDLGPAGQGTCNLVHVDDVVAAVLVALRVPGIQGQAYNLSLPEPPTWNEYFRRFAAALDVPFLPISAGRLAIERHLLAPPLKILQLAANRLRPGWQTPQPIRPWLLRLCAHPVRLDVGRAERDLGLHWTPLDQGLRGAADWVLAGATSDGPRVAR